MSPRLLALWLKETIALLRDRHGLLALFIMPTVFILVMTMALRDAFSPGVTIDAAYVVVDLDHSPHSGALIKRLDKTAAFRRLPLEDSPDLARQGILQGRQTLALVLPKGFGERLLTPSGADGQASEPLQLLLDPALNPALQLAFRNQVMAALGALRADELTRKAGKLFGLPPTAAADSEKDWLDEIRSEAVRSDANPGIPSSVQQNVPAWLIFAMFFVVIPVSSIFIIERQQGTLQRLRAMGVPFHLLLAGKLLPFFIVNQLQALLMVLVGIYLVPLFGSEALDMPGKLPLLFNWWIVSVAVSLAAVAWALLVASLARTSEQATIVGGVGNILMGAIGGIMVPKFIMPAAMQTLAGFSPMAWGLEGFHIVMLRHGSLGDLWPSLARLLTFAALSLLAAMWLNHRTRTAQS
ncbi:ABC transporter permease [Dechloromonas denitrificans]|uniref:ABC transporter permease n=1 Tax=Dechloromonas denitrificans TaxID=281362 RepID=UPI001CF7ED98|nr:ABC transporter permease [Dechloromonas denitrificans]UCV10206.1 ABC transporter permease [Dechloromonas denitrificans]